MLLSLRAPRSNPVSSLSHEIASSFLLLAMTLLFLFFAISTLSALDIPSQPDGYVTDRAGTLSAPAKEKLESALHNFEQQTSNQIIVAIFPTLDGGSLEDFSIRLAESWKVGKKGRDNGVVFLIFPKDHLMRIEVGYGLEGALPDALSGEIIRTVVAPYFKQGNFDAGVLAGVQAIAQATQKEYRGSPQQTAANAEISFFARLLFFLLGILFCIDLGRYVRYAIAHRTFEDRYHFLGWWFRFAATLFVLNLIFKIIFYSMLFSRGGFSGGGGRSDGGFSGGGGSFGGGGASGSW